MRHIEGYVMICYMKNTILSFFHLFYFIVLICPQKNKQGVKHSTYHQIPWEVINDDQSISVDHNIVLNRWKTDFEQLLNSSQSVTEITPEPMSGVYPVICDTTTLNADITVDEVRFALVSAKKGKALGEDGIPIEVLHNDRCLAYLVNLFNVCFMDGYIPDAWSRGIICPIIKDTKKITGIH